MISEVNLPTKECRNSFSARSQPEITSALISVEVERGYMYGPFNNLPFQNYRVSPIGIAEGKYSNKKRLILDLSSPHNDDEHSSINDLIDKNNCSMSYVKIDDAIDIILRLGRNSWLCKFDISDAFKICPIFPSQWPFFCIKWCEMYYFFVRLTFGCRSSPKIFDHVSQAICHIATQNYKILNILHLLDDFLTIDSPSADGERTMAIMMMIFKKLNIPVASHKTIGPVKCLEYLGIILDTEKMEARLPTNKVERICEFISKIYRKRKCTKRELLQLLGHLNFASRVILPGRTFVSYLINLSCTVNDLHHYVHLTKECRTDLYFWLRFLSNWNGVNMFYNKDYISSFDMELFTDASSTKGFGGYHKGEWFSSSWSGNLELPDEKKYSMAFLELYPIVVAAILWGSKWSKKRILFWCDNEATVAIVKKGRSKCLQIMSLMRQLTWCACKYNFHFSAKHVPGYENEISDALSRFQMDRFRRLAPNAALQPHQCPPSSEVMWS
ncbi:unnamed protein product [Mytilus edulis]|uniref:Reverse transcriptase domain-containing protein n=2 Tax=Mytilus TaxID=6548 RepID=A0A8B6E059_MYTGA|nr:unnamed protein product [Mytilus edulis]VDI27740.1 Hypothetical predicted protein [Mytilus galloprovincialis]